MMKRNEGKYPTYEKLPKNAMLVKDYARSLSIGEPAVYNRYSRAKADNKNAGFEIIIYYGMNFIIPE
jgi:hypothetical protein